MGYAEKPAAQIGARPAAPQVLEQRKKDLLHDLFAVGNCQAEAQQVAKKRLPQAIEKAYDLFFQRGATCFGRGGQGGQTCGASAHGNTFDCSVPGASAQIPTDTFRRALARSRFFSKQESR